MRCPGCQHENEADAKFCEDALRLLQILQCIEQLAWHRTWSRAPRSEGDDEWVDIRQGCLWTRRSEWQPRERRGTIRQGSPKWLPLTCWTCWRAGRRDGRLGGRRHPGRQSLHFGIPEEILAVFGP